jgi:hypothetical protein
MRLPAGGGWQGPVPAGCTPEPGTVRVPCPFRVELQVHGLETADDSSYSF